MLKFSYKSEPKTKNYFYLSFLLAFFCAVVIVLVKNALPPKVPLFYGQPAGQAQLAPSMVLLVAPAISLIVTLVNSIVANLTNDVFLKKTLAFSSFFVAIIVSVTVVKIIFLVGSF